MPTIPTYEAYKALWCAPVPTPDPVLGGYRVAVNPVVAPGKTVVFADAGIIAFHDRYDLMRHMFWANFSLDYRRIARATWEEWKAIRDRPIAD